MEQILFNDIRFWRDKFDHIVNKLNNNYILHGGLSLTDKINNFDKIITDTDSVFARIQLFKTELDNLVSVIDTAHTEANKTGFDIDKLNEMKKRWKEYIDLYKTKVDDINKDDFDIEILPTSAMSVALDDFNIKLSTLFRYLRTDVEKKMTIGETDIDVGLNVAKLDNIIIKLESFNKHLTKFYSRIARIVNVDYSRSIVEKVNSDKIYSYTAKTSEMYGLQLLDITNINNFKQIIERVVKNIDFEEKILTLVKSMEDVITPDMMNITTVSKLRVRPPAGTVTTAASTVTTTSASAPITAPVTTTTSVSAPVTTTTTMPAVSVATTVTPAVTVPTVATTSTRRASPTIPRGRQAPTVATIGQSPSTSTRRRASPSPTVATIGQSPSTSTRRRASQSPGRVRPAQTLQPMAGGEITNTLYTISSKLNTINDILDDISVSIKTLKELYTRYNYYILYLMFIIVSYGRKLDRVYYEYINRGDIQFYRSIVNNILDKFKTNNGLKQIKYMNKYHYVTLHRLNGLFDFLYRKLAADESVDINKCVGTISTDMMLFNHFKDILDSYHVEFQNKVMIYSRINDWGSAALLSAQKMFIKDDANPEMMIIDPMVCPALGISTSSPVKFNGVFDTLEFKDNGNISKYMTLETKISRKNGILLTTYGYSGTGKTFTLFGNDSKQGLLQSTLNNIKGLKTVYFRVYELYGLGVQYSHYWNGDVRQKLITYNMIIRDNTITINKHTERSDITSYISNDEDFLQITGDDEYISEVLKNFGKTVVELDRVRKEEKRIVKTPNNPDSSRSIIVYEFQNLIGTELIPMIIIDLPGREEIVQTYVDAYLNKKFMPTKYKTPFHKALLSSLAINPLYMAILVSGTIFEAFNTLPFDVRNRILTTKVQISDDVTDPLVDFENEYFTTLVGERQVTLEYIYDFSTSKWKREKRFDVMTNPQNTGDLLTSQPIRVHIKGDGAIDGESKPFSSHQVKVNKNSVQYQGALAIHLLNRMIVMSEFESIAHINEFIVKRYFDMSDVKRSIVDKPLFLKEYLDNSYVDKLSASEIDEEIRKTVDFTAFIVPYEGIYINENIVGIIKILAKDVMKKTDEEIKKLAEKQPIDELNFKQQKHLIRENNYNLYKKKFEQDCTRYENIYRSDAILNKIYTDNRDTYSSQKIFNYDVPLIDGIIKRYTVKRPFNFKGQQHNSLAIEDYKLFYLFTNNDLDKKCAHQYKLLNNTMSLIKAVEN
jgi:hypothetical protein